MAHVILEPDWINSTENRAGTPLTLNAKDPLLNRELPKLSYPFTARLPPVPYNSSTRATVPEVNILAMTPPLVSPPDGTTIRNRRTFADVTDAAGIAADHVEPFSTGIAEDAANELSEANVGAPVKVIG